MIDARGLSCPIPVVMVQKAVKQGAPEKIEVLVDSETCVENITRFAGNNGYEIAAEQDGADFRLTLTKK